MGLRFSNFVLNLSIPLPRVSHPSTLYPGHRRYSCIHKSTRTDLCGAIVDDR